MSAVDTSCYTIPPEKESGDSEINCYKSISCNSSTTSSHAIASEIMNDILDNAFEVIMSKNIQQQSPKTEKISSNTVGDILENILSTSSNNDSPNRHDETVLLDDEIKQIIKEMKFPPEQKNIICTKGVGDQLGDKLDVQPDKILVEFPKRNTLERKNRLTNLVRNSKQMLAKFVNNDNENELKMSKSEESHEEVLRVIDLESENCKDVNIGKAAEPGLVQLPSDSAMDMINLEPNIPKEDECQNMETEDITEKEETEIASCSFVKNANDNKKHVSPKKKKWNLGSKIFKYIKRHSKKE